MIVGFLVIIALNVLAAGLATVVARQRPDGRPLAIFLIVIAVADLLRAARGTWIVAGSVPPFTGWQRLLFHVEQALFLTWPAGLTAICWYTFFRRNPRPVFVLYAVIVAVLVAGYPTIRGHALGAAYAAVHGAALVVSFACMLLSWRRRLLPAPLEMRVLVCMLCIDAVLFTGPYLPWDPNPFERWNIAQLGYALMFIIASVLFARYLWRRRSSSMQPRSMPLY